MTTADLLTDFLLCPAAVAFETRHYFEGFCGEYVGDHTGSEQKCGSHLVVNHATLTKKVRSSFSRASLNGMSMVIVSFHN